MLSKIFLIRIIVALSLIAEIYLIINMFLKDKSWALYYYAVIGFALMPVSIILFIRTTKWQNTHKVIVITGVCVAWIILAAIAAFATYFYWLNNNGAIAGCSPGGLCPGVSL